MPHLEIIRLTPAGRGAVATFLLCGESAMDAFMQYWHGKKPTREHPTWGRLQLAASRDNEEAVVLCTAEGGIEMHVHGGEQIASAIETLFLQSGAVLKTWQEHFAGGRPEPDRAVGSAPVPAPCSRAAAPPPSVVGLTCSASEISNRLQYQSQRDLALLLLPYAPTERTAQILLDQYHGAYDREMAAIEQLSCDEERRRRLARLQELALLGKHLVEPFRVVLAGASNAGKSSLLNAILGFQRSLVYAVPGTTRDVVSGQTALDGFPVTFLDTAGFRTTDDELEQQGIDRSLGSMADADLVVWVIDSTVEEAQRPPCPAGGGGKGRSNVLVCWNKIDLVGSLPLTSALSRWGGGQSDLPTVPVSALTGEGIERLLTEVIRRLVPSPPKPQEAVMLTHATAF